MPAAFLVVDVVSLRLKQAAIFHSAEESAAEGGGTVSGPEEAVRDRRPVPILSGFATIIQHSITPSLHYSKAVSLTPGTCGPPLHYPNTPSLLRCLPDTRHLAVRYSIGFFVLWPRILYGRSGDLLHVFHGGWLQIGRSAGSGEHRIYPFILFFP